MKLLCMTLKSETNVQRMCAKSMWPRLLDETINSYPYYVHLNLETSFEELTEQEKMKFLRASQRHGP